MREEYRKYIDTAVSKKKEYKKVLPRLRKLKPGKLNSLFHSLHHEAFEIIDCLECANCCTSIGPRVNDNDIIRLARKLRVKPSDIMSNYMRVDEDNDIIMKSMPCPFLMPDNYCSVYDSRPLACKGYPHTDHSKMAGLLNLTLKNSETCPAVAWIFEQLLTELNI